MTNPDVRPAPASADLVSEIVAGNGEAFQDLYERLRGLHYYYLRRVGMDADELYQQTMVDLLVQIRRGDLREPERLAGYARAMAQRKVVGLISDRTLCRSRERSLEGRPLRDSGSDPESAAIKRQEEEIAARILNSLPERHREVLVRFYLHGYSAERIQADLSLTANQFRLIKYRAKARFAELCRARLACRKGPGRSADPLGDETACPQDRFAVAS